MENNTFNWGKASKFEKIFFICFVIFIFGTAIFSYFNKKNYREEISRHGIIVPAVVKSIVGSRSSFIINVDYNFRGKKFNSTFYTDDLDTLKKLTRGGKVDIAISSLHPDDDEVKLVSITK